MMLTLRVSRLSDADGMRFHLRTEREVPASAERLFEVLATGEGQRGWANGYRSTSWLTDGPHGVGSVRDIHLQWISVRERFLVWEPSRRFAFSSDAMTLPLALELIEDIKFEPISEGRTRMSWTVHFSPRAVITPVSGLLASRVLAPMFESFADGLARYATAQP